MADQPTPTRRFAKRSIVALAGVVLLVVGYVESFRMFWWCEGHGTTDPYLRVIALVLFAPVHYYSEIPFLPGAVRLRAEMLTQLEEGRAAARKELRAAVRRELEERHPVRTISD